MFAKQDGYESINNENDVAPQSMVPDDMPKMNRGPNSAKMLVGVLVVLVFGSALWVSVSSRNRSIGPQANKVLSLQGDKAVSGNDAPGKSPGDTNCHCKPEKNLKGHDYNGCYCGGPSRDTKEKCNGQNICQWGKCFAVRTAPEHCAHDGNCCDVQKTADACNKQDWCSWTSPYDDGSNNGLNPDGSQKIIIIQKGNTCYNFRNYYHLTEGIICEYGPHHMGAKVYCATPNDAELPPPGTACLRCGQGYKAESADHC